MSGEGNLGKPPSGSPQVVCNGLQIALRPSGFSIGVRFTAFPARFRGEDQDLGSIIPSRTGTWMAPLANRGIAERNSALTSSLRE